MQTSYHRHNNDVKNISVAFFLNLSFTLVEFVGGVLTNSMAILSDAVHDLGDSFSLGLSWYFQKLSKKPGDKAFTYGYKRFSLLGAVVNSAILLVGSVVILINALPRLLHPNQPNTQGMLLLALLGVLINGLAVLRLRRGNSLNERVVSLHLLEDVLGWVAVFVGALVMHFVDAPVIDPLLSVAITIFILYNVYRNMRQSFRIILQGSPLSLDLEAAAKTVSALEGVRHAEHLHAWSVDGEYNVLTMHVVVDREMTMRDQQKLKQRIRTTLNTMGVQHATIELDLSDDSGSCKL
ncbi:MAG: cation diffusion facilitator family transporter [Proteiniphilum sp.]|nr:cation diffusion facilitator family transporter [Proteiniphilum sp.]